MISWALVVGINHYHPAAGLNPLRGAVDDAVDFAEWLLDDQGGGVAPENLRLWTYPQHDAPPPAVANALNSPPLWAGDAPDFSRAPRGGEIRRTLDVLARDAAQAGVDRLYVLFAGHGLQTRPLDYRLPDQVCFLAGDYRPDFITESLVPGDYTRRMMRRYGPVEVLMFFDCCRTELAPYQADPPIGGALVLPTETNRCCGIGLAAAPGGTAFEVPLEAPNRGAFTRLLTFGLRNVRHNEVLTAGQLEAYLRQALPRLTSPRRQYPSIELDPRDYDLKIVQGPAVGPYPNLVIDLSARAPGSEIVVVYPDRSQTTLAQQPAPYIIPAPLGPYAFETPAGEVLLTEAHTGPDETHVHLQA